RLVERRQNEHIADDVVVDRPHRLFTVGEGETGLERGGEALPLRVLETIAVACPAILGSARRLSDLCRDLAAIQFESGKLSPGSTVAGLRCAPDVLIDVEADRAPISGAGGDLLVSPKAAPNGRAEGAAIGVIAQLAVRTERPPGV